MTRIYFVRHGESTGNAKGVFQGVTDNPLTPLGVAQGEKLGERFGDIPYDAVYTSPLCRAVDSAHLLNAKQQKPVIVDEGLLELDGGEMENTPLAELTVRFPQEVKIWNEALHTFRGPGLTEGGAAFTRQRMLDAVRRLVEKHPGQSIVIVAHGFLLRVFNAFVQDIPFEELNRLGWGDNTCVTCVDFEPDFTPHPVYINDASHLPQSLKTPDHWK